MQQLLASLGDAASKADEEEKKAKAEYDAISPALAEDQHMSTTATREVERVKALQEELKARPPSTEIASRLVRLAEGLK